jgi:hypothetical protein
MSLFWKIYIAAAIPLLIMSYIYGRVLFEANQVKPLTHNESVYVPQPFILPRGLPSSGGGFATYTPPSNLPMPKVPQIQQGCIKFTNGSSLCQ